VRVELHQAMRSAATIRYYSLRPVAPAILYRILDSARFAPSGGNRQGWRVAVVLDAERRRAIHELYQSVWGPYREQIERAATPNTQTRLASRSLAAADHFASHLSEIPVHLLVSVDLGVLQLTDLALERPSIAGGASVYPFVHNLLLAARAEGLGAAITTMLCTREPQVREMFGIPDGHALAALVTLGHPLTERIPTSLRRRSVEEFAFMNDFGGEPLTGGARP